MGMSMRDGVRLAIDEINRSGGVLGRHPQGAPPPDAADPDRRVWRLHRLRLGDRLGQQVVLARERGARLRPHIVFFGEIPLEMDCIQREISKASLMLVVGTSGSVYPAANFVHWSRQNGARTVYLGPEQPLNASAFTHVVEGKAGVVLPGLFALS